MWILSVFNYRYLLLFYVQYFTLHCLRYPVSERPSLQLEQESLEGAALFKVVQSRYCELFCSRAELPLY